MKTTEIASIETMSAAFWLGIVHTSLWFPLISAAHPNRPKASGDHFPAGQNGPMGPLSAYKKVDCQVHSLVYMTKQHSETENRLTSKGRAMRDRIVQSAADLVFEAGARETTLDHVRSAVGASKSQLYHYFGDKDELLHAVIDFQGARIIGAQQPELAAIDSVASLKRWRDKLVQLGDTFGKIGGCPIGSLASELAGPSENHRRALQVHFDHWAAQIEDGLRRMQANGCLEPSLDPKALSTTFLTAIQGGLLLAKLHRSSTALATALDEVIRSIEGHSRRPKEGAKR